MSGLCSERLYEIYYNHVKKKKKITFKDHEARHYPSVGSHNIPIDYSRKSRKFWVKLHSKSPQVLLRLLLFISCSGVTCEMAFTSLQLISSFFRPSHT